MIGRVRVPTGTAGLATDALALAYVLVWVLLGAEVADQIAQLAELSGSVESVGAAVGRTGDAVAGLGGLPLVGGELTEAGRAVADAARDAQAEARASGEQARDAGGLLGFAVALIPSLPVLLLYAPARWFAERERRAVRRALARGDRAAVEALLAQRALLTLPYRRLLALSDDPAGDVRAGRHERLAEAELRRLGL